MSESLVALLTCGCRCHKWPYQRGRVILLNRFSSVGTLPPSGSAVRRTCSLSHQAKFIPLKTWCKLIMEKTWARGNFRRKFSPHVLLVTFFMHATRLLWSVEVCVNVCMTDTQHFAKGKIPHFHYLTQYWLFLLKSHRNWCHRMTFSSRSWCSHDKSLNLEIKWHYLVYR